MNYLILEYEGIMNQDKQRKFMDFMMNVKGNMDQQMYGDIVQMCLII